MSESYVKIPEEYLPYLKKGDSVKLNINADPPLEKYADFLMEVAGVVNGGVYNFQEVEDNHLVLSDGFEDFRFPYSCATISCAMQERILTEILRSAGEKLRAVSPQSGKSLLENILLSNNNLLQITTATSHR